MNGAVTYNLFRQGSDAAILCAVPNDKPVPAFVRGPAWVFDSTVTVGHGPAQGFEANLAKAAGDLNGFYVFLAPNRAGPGRQESAKRSAAQPHRMLAAA
jgi:hypothetical protein